MNEDLRALWVALHDYMICQASGDGPALALAYTRLVDEHNRIYHRYGEAIEPPPLRVAGV